MPQFAPFVAAIAALACLAAMAAAPASACQTCDEDIVDVLDGSGEPPLDLDLVTGFSFSKSAAFGDVILDAGGQALPSNEDRPGLVGEIQLVGLAGRDVTIVLPSAIELRSNGGAVLTVADVALDRPGPFRLDETGRLEIGFSGIIVAKGEPPRGNYRADFTVEAHYE